MPEPGRLAAWVRAGLRQPPQVTATRALAMARRSGEGRRDRRRDAAETTYLPDDAIPATLLRYLDVPPVELLRPHAEAIAGVTGLYLDHRFDLLGSGWVRVRHGVACAGLEGHRYPAKPTVEADLDGGWLAGRVTAANLPESRRVWQLVDEGYEPIDWQLDFKSGWRWSEATWYRDIEYGSVPGADVKVPWELARMQHLPQLALATALARAGESGLSSPERYTAEFRNEVLDFIATNPPRFGVNWTTTMDVAIRVANLLVAHDLFVSIGTAFDPDFEAAFRRSVLEHARHIAANLEWAPDLRANHYLADIVGLLFTAAYLPGTAETDAWLTLAGRELIAETRLQFNDDGTGFEASTSYHRLSAEMVTWAVALILSLDAEKRRALPNGGASPLPGWLAERLERMAGFSMDATKPSGRVCQIGDNDNGRFLKLVPVVRPVAAAAARERFANLTVDAALPDGSTYWAEDHLDHRPLVGAIAGLFERADLERFAATARVETAVVRLLGNGACLLTDGEAVGHARSIRVGDDQALDDIGAWLGARAADQRRSTRIALDGGGATDGLERIAYPGFGLFILRSRRVYLAIRCGPVGQNGVGGHAHNDQLGIELAIDGVDRLRDPGTDVYTPLPERRNAYRSVRAHAIPTFDGPEPADLEEFLFRLGRGSEATCTYWGPAGFAGRWQMTGSRVLVLRARLEDDRVTLDYGLEGARFVETDGAGTLPFSPGYGIVERAGPP
jgi:hypothetical protein